jgi:hypothetical protein
MEFSEILAVFIIITSLDKFLLFYSFHLTCQYPKSQGEKR